MIELKIAAMSCGHCINTIKTTVHALDSAARVEADLATKQVLIESKLPAAAFIRALAEQEYEAELL